MLVIARQLCLAAIDVLDAIDKAIVDIGDRAEPGPRDLEPTRAAGGIAIGVIYPIIVLIVLGRRGAGATFATGASI